MNVESIRIRPASVDDLIDVQSCARAAYSKYIERMDKEPAPMHADFASQIAQGHVHVALRYSSFAGYVVFYPQGDHYHLENVAVLPDQAGKGIGKRLFEYVEQTAKKAGLNAVELYTNEAMIENLQMYPRLGYVETKRKQKDGFNRVFFRKLV